MKKIIIASSLALSLVTSTALADVSPKSGFYVGGDFGTNSITSATKFDSLKVGMGSSSLTSNLHAGYRIFDEKSFYGVEVGYSLLNSDILFDDDGLKQKNGYSALVNFGYGISNEAFVFTSLGITSKKYEASSSNLGILYKNTKNLTGGVIGLGLEYFISDNISVTGKYSYEKSFDKISVTRVTSGNTIEYNPSNQAFTIGIRYNF